MPSKVYTVKEIADGFYVSESTVRRWIREGKIKAHKNDAKIYNKSRNSWIVLPSDLKRFIKKTYSKDIYLRDITLICFDL